MLLAQPLPVGFWTLALAVTLPETVPGHDPKGLDIRGYLVTLWVGDNAWMRLGSGKLDLRAKMAIRRSLLDHYLVITVSINLG